MGDIFSIHLLREMTVGLRPGHLLSHLHSITGLMPISMASCF